MSALSKKIIVAPLHWGIGHASRCVPIIKMFLKYNCDVTICGNGSSFMLLKKEFPELNSIELKDFQIRYSQYGAFFTLSMLKYLPAFFRSIESDREQVKEIYEKIKPDCIISDNRYGFYHKDCFSVIITHQIKPKLPISAFLVKKTIHNKIFEWLKNFNEVWVPDYAEEPSLSGELSHNTGFDGNVRFIGPLTRFSGKQADDSQNVMPNFITDVLVIGSGPDPMRSQFIGKVKNILLETDYKFVVIKGAPDKITTYPIENYTIFNHLPTDLFEKFMLNTKVVVARSGYSTIMDLYALGKKAVLVPTPGQTEQLYLAKLHKRNENFLITRNINSIPFLVEKLINKKETVNNNDFFNENILEEHIANFLKKI